MGAKPNPPKNPRRSPKNGKVTPKNNVIAETYQQRPIMKKIILLSLLQKISFASSFDILPT